MPKSNAPGHINGRRPGLRMVAVVLAAILLIASVEPAFAYAEVESEGEGSAPPGFPAGLETVEPAGSETVLEEIAPASGEAEVEEAVTPSTVEPEPAPPVVPTEPTAAPEVAAPAAAAAPAPAEAVTPTEPSPSYEPAPAPSTPSYEPSPEPSSSAPVQNEAIVAPADEKSPGPNRSEGTHPVPETVAPTVEPTAPISAPTAAPEPLAAAPTTSADRGGDLRGRQRYTVGAGDCLWSIAAGFLPAGASNSEISAEVARLWKLNVGRIGTGNPSLILVGTELRLT
ncbi:MAG: LysM peptidoglycan-binding domain-containing protein [Actinobacteria bacterium]|nr:LysM peptidoglycan-binding domain-containing protein [Actinomycetota bacterium]